MTDELTLDTAIKAIRETHEIRRQRDAYEVALLNISTLSPGDEDKAPGVALRVLEQQKKQYQYQVQP